jgi:hypothetical protein
MKLKILTGIGGVIFAIVLGFNINVVTGGTFNDRVVFLDNVEALATEDNTSPGPKGPTKSYKVECTTTTTTTTTTNNSNSTNWGAGGSVNVGLGNWGVGANGNYGNTNSNGSTTTTTTTTTSKSTRTGYDCPNQNKDSCTPYKPC